jgi:hypothetical protein
MQVNGLPMPRPADSIWRTLRLNAAPGARVRRLTAETRSAAHKRRRWLVSRWRRTTRWEFWPAWALYPPLAGYIALLGVKHRSATVFTAANPAIEAGGFVRESKYEILRGLAGGGDFVARSCLIEGRLKAADKLRLAMSFMAEHSLTLPLVLKPDCGQRGSGVVVVRSHGDLVKRLARSRVNTIVQEFVSGPEFGVFYYRRPGETAGHIFSITDKRMPAVTGDGVRTLEELILDDERAVCGARLYCDRFRHRLAEVPAEGEVIPLAELGTHCRGAMFFDGGHLETAALAARFDTIARSFNGFFFGRFDVRAAGGVEAFQEGREFKIVELNGVTSEATHIYDPGCSLLDAYRVLMRQWAIAFEIGAENRRRGAAVASPWTLIRLAREYAKLSRHHLPER